MHVRHCLPLFLVLIGSPLLAGATPAATDDTAAAPMSILIDPDMLMAGFANNHPDLFYRRNALEDLANGRHTRGVRRLTRAAYYGDKPAQALMAEILWNGSHDQKMDRPTAYAWMDLAAERGYPELLVQREAYWKALNSTERQQALAVGEQIYARYGDDTAQPRLARRLRQELRSVTGSRTGFAGNTTILALQPNGSSIRRAAASGQFEGDNIAPAVAIPGSKYYAQTWWRPELYFKTQDLTWYEGVTQRYVGSTSVGDITPVEP